MTETVTVQHGISEIIHVTVNRLVKFDNILLVTSLKQCLNETLRFTVK